MAYVPSLDTLAHARFRECFGLPRNWQGGGEQWSLIPAPGVVGVHVMLNGTHDGPVVWVFDPHDHSSVVNYVIRKHAEIDEVITELQERVKRAAAQSAGTVCTPSAIRPPETSRVPGREDHMA